MRIFLTPFILLFLIACQPLGSGGSASSPLTGLDHRAGFLDVHVKAQSGQILVKLPTPDEDGLSLSAIHTARLTAGLGSNPVGLDRGWGDSGRVVHFRQHGNRVILEQPNLRYRANADNPLEARAVAESFAPSFLASFDILDRDGGLVIDLTDFLKSDVLNLQQYLSDAGQGSFKLQADRTLVDSDQALSFPDNAEFDVFFTLASTDAGREVSTTAASGNVATLIQHHSFVRLPDANYEPLKADPRAGVIELVHYDYSAPLSAPIETRLAVRHRLVKDRDGTVINPIVYYIDGGAPEPIRSALIEGASWWADAFEAAGYPRGYRVEVLPADAHPLDVRYNVVQWVHRQTRGWSYGGGVVDPRTGERLKGHVNLGSLRVRQDRMIFEGLLGARKTDSGAADDPVQLALARIRQLSAHEVGHAIGIMHNFAASSDNKASVMDYPAPDVRLIEGALDVSNAYGVGIGDWDKVSLGWLYGEETGEAKSAILEDAYARGLSYVADADGRGVGSAHPDGSVWDNGSDAVEALEDVLAVRRFALDRFGPNNLPKGRPQSDLNAAIVPIYLYHRYQTAAAAKSLGGLSFDYGYAGQAAEAEIVSPVKQRAALNAVLDTVTPEVLDIPDSVLAHLTPRLGTFSFADNDRELFRSSAGAAFDVVAAADTAAGLSFAALLHPERAARLVEFHRRDIRNPSLEEVLRTMRRRVLSAPGEGRTEEIGQAVRNRLAYAMMDLASADATPAVKARVDASLREYASDLRRTSTDTDLWLVGEINRFLDRPAPAASASAAVKTLPPGSPIGEACWHCPEIMGPELTGP